MSIWSRWKRRRRVVALSSGRPQLFEVNADTSMRIAAVYSSVSLLSSTVAALPAVLYRDNGKEKQRATGHALSRLLRHAPNALMCPADFFESVMSSLLLRGNAYVRIYRSAIDARVTALVPLAADSVEVKPTEDKASLIYKVRGLERALTKGEVWHIRAFTQDGINGLTPVEHARSTFELSMAADKATTAAAKNTAKPAGILLVEGDLEEGEDQELANAWQKAHSGDEAGTVAVLSAGMKFEPLKITADDASWIEARKFSRTEIAALFRVPVHMIGSLERATWANIESLGQEFVTYSLNHWFTKIEQSFNRDVLLPSEVDEGYYLRFNAEALLRGNLLTRMQAAQIKIQNGISSPNEIRALEEENPREGGDVYLTPANMRLLVPDPGAPGEKE